MQQYFDHPKWGPVLIRRNKRAKRIILRIKDGQQVQVTLPYSAPRQAALSILEDKKDWIEQHLAQAQHQQAPLNWDLALPIRHKTLRLLPHASDRSRLQAEGEALTLYLPDCVDLKTAQGQKFLKENIVEVLRYEAKSYLPDRTRQLAQQHGIAIQNVFIKNVKSRWGSCSNRGNINLSLHLMLLPDAWIDYVICHELAHITYLDHSPAFWAHLEALLPGAKAIDKAMKGYRRPF